jgi:hypothetical protein
LVIKAGPEIESYYADLPIEADIVVVNTDVSMKLGGNSAGLGVIVRDVDGLLLVVELGSMQTKNNIVF